MLIRIIQTLVLLGAIVVGGWAYVQYGLVALELKPHDRQTRNSFGYLQRELNKRPWLESFFVTDGLK